MKKVMYLLTLLAGLSAAASNPPEISEKVINAFKQTFTGAEEVSWNETGSNCQADFKMSEIRVSAIYDNDGNLLKTTRYYDEKTLPSIVLAKVKMKYPGKLIFGVTEITTTEDVVYHIVLRDDKNWYWIKSDAYGHQELTKQLKRGEPREAGF
ncbi:MAG: hypothetical protein ABI688_11335 [Bacteroidota bacterium]